jgi:hypothetical protein
LFGAAPTSFDQVFNRSHYEDVLVVKLLKLVDDKTIQERYAQINAFEDYLTANGTIIIKVVLHISKEEQRHRLYKYEPIEKTVSRRVLRFAGGKQSIPGSSRRLIGRRTTDLTSTWTSTTRRSAPPALLSTAPSRKCAIFL